MSILQISSRRGEVLDSQEPFVEPSQRRNLIKRLLCAEECPKEAIEMVEEK